MICAYAELVAAVAEKGRFERKTHLSMLRADDEMLEARAWRTGVLTCKTAADNNDAHLLFRCSR